MYNSSQGNAGSTVIAKIDPGSDLFTAINKILEEHQIECGYIPLIQGCLTECRLLMIEGDAQKGKSEPQASKITLQETMAYTGNGTIARDKNNKPFIHIHPTISKNNGTVLLGHLIAAKVCLTTEIVIVEITGVKMGRKKEPKANNETLLYLEQI